MRILVYSLCVAIALLCAWLLVRAYYRTKFNLLFWSSVYFFGQIVIGVLVILDNFVFPEFSLYPFRLIISFVSIVSLLYGLIFMREEI
ncbi:MAG: hypothetical protein JNM27_02885 [Leptospirales bacterium]|nr:hypothetical protein [Leptospirales bacterium]